MTFTKTALVSAVSAIAIMAAAPVSAADEKRAPATTMHSTTQVQIKADDLVGKDIKNVSGDTVGDIESVIIDNDGKVAAVIVGVGGFLGMGEREVAIDWNDLSIRNNGDIIRTGMTKAELKSMPQYNYERPDYRNSAFVDTAYLERRMERAHDNMTSTEWVDAHGLKASKLIGADVVNSQGETIGEVDDLVIVDGRSMLVLSVGEFLGMGGHDVTVDLEKAKVHQQRDDADDLRVSVSMTKDQLKGLPKYDSQALGQR